MRSPRFALLISSLLGLALAACGGGSGGPQCADGVDNDEDGLIDEADPSCNGGDTEDANDPVRDCNDGVDNDADDLIDYPEDPGCTSGQDNSELNSPIPECDDGEDNDDDGFTDYPDDPGCSSPLQNTETDDCPDGPECPQCANNLDDDEDGDLDFPADTGCTAASDDSERTADPTACAQLPFEQLPTSGLVAGVLVAGTSVVSSSSCGGLGPELAYELYVDAPTVIVATTDITGTAFDTVLYVRERCGDMSTEVACNDNASAQTVRSTLTATLDPGFYYLIVDGDATTSVGGFQLQVTFYPGLGTTCDPEATNACAPGMVCRLVDGNASETCENPVCNDGRDDDADDLLDYPNDPGCSSPQDSDESDDCAGAATTCPECGNGDDDDGDGDTDFPMDMDCESASQDLEGCGMEADPIGSITGPVTTGTTVGLTNNFSGTCISSSGPDKVFLLNLPAVATTLQLDTIGSPFDTVLMLKTTDCGTSDLACNDEGGGGGTSLISLTNQAAGSYVVVVDGWLGASGPFTLNVHGTVAAGAACDSPLFSSGAFTCATGEYCDGTSCVPVACNNSIDDDGDGDGAGYPQDPGCTSALDNDETDTCPFGVGCPLCGNAMDDDLDGDIDYPDDVNCTSASSNTESCADADPIGEIVGPVTTGTTVGLTGNFGGTCSSTLVAPDKVYLLDLPATATSLTIDTIGSTADTVVLLKSAACEAADITCDDNSGGGTASKITRTNQAAGTYAVVVDGKTAGGGAFTLNVHGQVAAGAACDSPLFPSGALTCAAGEYCNGVMCVPTVCNDTVDADLDGKNGYPTDPGCTDISDTSEVDDCPSGPNCPRCGNAVDDDGDGMNNYPADPNCVAASTDDESGCASAADPYVEITGPTTLGNLDTEGNDFEPSCLVGSGRDSAFELNVPFPLQSLFVDTDGSSVNTVVAVRANGCTPATDLGCDNNSGQDLLDSWLALGATAAGRYAVILDSTSGATGAFALHVRGVIAQGNSCSPALEAAGLFVCNATSHCAGTAGLETCMPFACSDGISNDADGLIDALDPGCMSGADDNETDPGTAPQCADATDNDSDGLNNYPADLGCKRAGDPLEFMWPESTGVQELTTARVSNSTTGAGADFVPSCAPASAAPERVYSITIPGLMSSLTFNAALPVASGSYDSVLFVRRDNSATDVGCQDSAVITLTNAAAGTYSIFVDGWGTAAGNYQLGVWGVIASGQACDPAQIQAGIFNCATGTSCVSNVCQ